MFSHSAGAQCEICCFCLAVENINCLADEEQIQVYGIHRYTHTHIYRMFVLWQRSPDKVGLHAIALFDVDDVIEAHFWHLDTWTRGVATVS